MKDKNNNLELKKDLFYDPETHYWVRPSGQNEAVVGMSTLVQETSGSFVAILFDQEGNKVNKGQSIGSAEAEKHVGPIKTPLSGTVTAINHKVIENPRLLNDDPYGEGWLFKLALSDGKTEMAGMIAGDQIESWFNSELDKFKQKGWIAQ